VQPQPLALGYLRTDGGHHGTLTDAEIAARTTAITNRARSESFTLKDLYLEDRPGSTRMFSRLIGAATFYLIDADKIDTVIIFEDDDLGTSSEEKQRARHRIEDLGARIEMAR
jgi:hypothetical protein